MLQSEVCSAGTRELLCQETLQDVPPEEPLLLNWSLFLIKNSNLAILKYAVI